MNACIINVWGYTEILPLTLFNFHRINVMEQRGVCD